MGFTYDDKTSKSMSLKARLTSWQVTGAVRSNTTTVPGKYGVTDFGADFDSREISVECNIYPKGTFAALVAALDDIALWLDPTAGLRQLIFDDLPDRYFMARINSQVDCDRLIRSAGSFTLKFFCPDPFAYAVVDEEFTISSDGDSTVKRTKGNVESNPIYRIQGVIEASVSNYISITTNGQELKIVNATLAEDETLVVDTEKMTAYVEDEDGITLRNGLPYLKDLNFPTLDVGDNTISISTNNATFSGLEIEARSRWR